MQTRRRASLWFLVSLLLTSITTAASAAPKAAKLCGFTPQEWSRNVALGTKERRGDPLPFTYANLLYAISLIELAERAHDVPLRTYSESIVDKLGTSEWPPTGFNKLETAPAGRLFLELYHRTGDEKYRKEAARVYQTAQTLPRTQEGVIAWRPEQVWLDGAWHTLPLYSEYAKETGDKAIFDDIQRQLTSIAKHSGDPRTGLAFHGWDEKKDRFWSDPVTGASSALWSRAIGWYAMTFVDVLDEIPADHPAHAQLIGLLQQVAAGLARFQDPKTGLWYEVIDQPQISGNYLESSASAMFVYTLARGVNRGWLDRRFARNAAAGYTGLIRDKIDKDPEGRWIMIDIVQSAGLGAPPDWPPGSPPPSKRDAAPRGRDGSAQYYIEQPIVKDHSYGVGPMILAGLEVQDLMTQSTLTAANSRQFAQLRCGR